MRDHKEIPFEIKIDQTPTPTRLIKNCEEVGLFDDLKHVNPFDETFRKAIESKQQSNSYSETLEKTNNHNQSNNCLTSIHNEDSSLHTPQVYPNVSTDVSCHQNQEICNISLKNQENFNTSSINYDKEKSINNKKKQKSNGTSKKKIQSDIKNITNQTENSIKLDEINQNLKFIEIQTEQYHKRNSVILPSAINIIQPQIITLGLPEAAVLPSKPILLPKTTELTNLLPFIKTSAQSTETITTESVTNSIQKSYSSSSPSPLTGETVKDKLKYILCNRNSLSPITETKTTKTKCYLRRRKKDSHKTLVKEVNKTHDTEQCNDNKIPDSKDDCLERRRAAASRYRRKIKKQQNDIKDKNEKLLAENQLLRQTVKELQEQLSKHQNCNVTVSSSALNHTNKTYEPLILTTPTGTSMFQIPNAKVLMSLPRIVCQPVTVSIDTHANLLKNTIK